MKRTPSVSGPLLSEHDCPFPPQGDPEQVVASLQTSPNQKSSQKHVNEPTLFEQLALFVQTPLQGVSSFGSSQIKHSSMSSEQVLP